MSTAYADKLLDPRWQKKRILILQRDNFTCQQCYSTENTLMVHHLYYGKNLDPWEAEDDWLITLCKECHDYYHERIPQCHKIVTDMMKIKLKNTFITGCASDLFESVNNLNDFIYLLWEFKDDEESVIESLSKMLQNRVDNNKNNSKCHA